MVPKREIIEVDENCHPKIIDYVYTASGEINGVHKTLPVRLRSKSLMDSLV